MREIVIYLGLMGSGKDYEANLLEGHTKIPFALCLREWTWQLLDWSPQTESDYEHFKNNKILIPNNICGLSDKQGASGRHILQAMGDICRVS